jgi:hypothetical protein
MGVCVPWVSAFPGCLRSPEKTLGRIQDKVKRSGGDPDEYLAALYERLTGKLETLTGQLELLKKHARDRIKTPTGVARPGGHDDRGAHEKGRPGWERPVVHTQDISINP